MELSSHDRILASIEPNAAECGAERGLAERRVLTPDGFRRGSIREPYLPADLMILPEDIAENKIYPDSIASVVAIISQLQASDVSVLSSTWRSYHDNYVQM